MPVSVNRPGPWTHRDVPANGARFHVALAGPEPVGSDDVPLVVLLHGFPECWWTWREVMPALADAGHRVAAMDLRGFGGSDRPPSGYDLVTLARDVAGVARSLGHTRAAVVGNGVGGQVSWVMPALERDLVCAIAPVAAPHPLALRSLRSRLLSGAALQYAGLKVPRLAERSLRTRPGMEKLLRASTVPATHARVLASAGYYAELVARPGAARAALETVRHSFLGRAEVDALDPPVAVPVLSVQGELDPVTPAQAFARDTHRVSGHLHQATVRGVGHFPQEEDPEALTAVLLPFLAETCG